MTGSSKPPSTVANGRYQIEKKLGAGCFGEVWQGRDKQTNEKVEVKFEDSSGHALQLEHEQHVLKILAQPKKPQGFAELFWCGQEQRFMCLVMEMLGKSLEDRLQGLGSSQGGQPKFNAQTAVLIAEQVLRRIEYLHSKGIVHRDIKPENFMFGIKSRIHHLYLIDFGLSKNWLKLHLILTVLASFTSFTMPAAMKVMKATKAKKVNSAMKTKGQKAMTKGSLLTALADATELKKGDVGKILNSLTEIGTEEVKKSGKFILPGLCMIKTRQKPATKAGKKLMFGKEVMVKAQPAKTVVKASPVAALKSQI